MKLKFSFLFLLTVFILNTHAQEQWQWLNPKPSGYNNRDVCFISYEVGFVVNSSEILMTTDAGQTWSKHGEILDGLDIEFSGTTGYIMGYDRIYKSSNSGITWNKLSGLIASDFRSIQVVSPDTVILSNRYNLYKTFDGGQHWQSIVVNAEGNILNDISFVNSRLGFGTGYGASIYKTTNGGSTWTAVYPPNPSSWSWDKIYFVNKDLGFAFYDSGITSLRTDDGGVTWTTFENVETIYTIHFVNDTTGFIGGEDGAIYKTTDAGVTWSVLNGTFKYGEAIFGLFFTDINTGYLVGLDGRIKKTTDSGLTFQQYSPSYRDIKGLVFTSNETGYCMIWGDLLKTTDGGNTWNVIPSNMNGSFTSIDFVNDKIGYAIFDIYQEEVYKTTNGGISWSLVPIEYPILSNDIMALDFINADTGFVTGGYGSSYVHKTVDGGQTWIKIGSEYFTSIKFVNDKVGYGLKKGYSFYGTTDGGITWTKLFGEGYSNLNSFTFLDEYTVFLTGNEGKCYKTTDGGITWEKLEVVYDDYTDIKFRDKNIGYLNGDDLYKTINAGVTWQKLTLPVQPITSSYIAITPNDKIYLGGEGAMILGSTVTSDSVSLISMPAISLAHDSVVLMGVVASNCLCSVENLKFGFSPPASNNHEIDATPFNVSPGSANRVSALLTGLAPSTEYIFWLKGTCNGKDYFSEIKTFYTAPKPQGVEDNKFSAITLFPNPSPGMVTINSSEPVILIELIDQTCRTLRYYNHLNVIDLSPFSSGVYFLKIRLKDYVVVKKVIKE